MFTDTDSEKFQVEFQFCLIYIVTWVPHLYFSDANHLAVCMSVLDQSCSPYQLCNCVVIIFQIAAAFQDAWRHVYMWQLPLLLHRPQQVYRPQERRMQWKPR